VFASILDRYPGASPAEIENVIRAQFDAGMGMLGDGIVWDVSGSIAAMDAAVGAWNDAAETARALADRETPGIEPPLVKACLLGPWTATARSAGDVARRAATARVRDAAEALFEAGAPVVQLVEDALAQLDPGDADASAAAHRALVDATQPASGHLSLSVGGGSVDRLGAAFLFGLPFASYAFDLVNGPDNWRLIADAPADRGILCGVADCRTEARDEEAVMIWAARYAASTGGRGLERVALCPSSGLQSLGPDAAARKLDGLAAAARKAGLPTQELAQSIDPRAVDARTSAMGRFEPGLRRQRSGTR